MPFHKTARYFSEGCQTITREANIVSYFNNVTNGQGGVAPDSKIPLYERGMNECNGLF
jgi:hypothetical protein